jgi:hypothetical protein
MKPYSRMARCERCAAKFTFSATRRDGGKPVTVVKIPCPSCKNIVALEVSCDLDESTIEVVGIERGR